MRPPFLYLAPQIHHADTSAPMPSGALRPPKALRKDWTMSIHLPGQARPLLALALLALLNACGSAPETPPPSAEARTIRQLAPGQ